MTPSAERAGLGFAALCALNGAFVAPVARLTTQAANPLYVAAATTLFAAAGAFCVLGLRGQLTALARGPDSAVLIGLGALGTMVPSILFFLGTARTSALDAVLCLQSEPAYSLLFAWMVLGHRLTVRRVASVGLLLLGIACAVGGRSSADPLGIALLLATPVAWQLSHLVVLRRLVSTPPEVLTGARYLWGGLWLTLAAVVLSSLRGEALWPTRFADAQLPVLALQGIVLSFVGTMLWYQAIARIDLARATAIVVPSIPLLTLATAFLIVGETPSARQLVGLCLVAAGVLSFVRAPHAVETLERVPTQTAPIGTEAAGETGVDAA